jgi:hypothetical protein
MQLTNENITKFRLLYKKNFGKEITKEEAYTMGLKLIRLIEILYRINLNK